MRNVLFVMLFLIAGMEIMYAQTIDRSQYEETNSEDLAWWGDTNPRNTEKKFKMWIEFVSSSGTSYRFRETHGTVIAFYRVSQRWNLISGQRYMVYFTARAPAPSGNGDFRVIDDIEIVSSADSNARPWQQFIDDGRHGRSGWYLEDLGNGTYREVYFD